jgi:hypothetical protein
VGSQPATVEDVGVDHGRLDVLVAEEFLDGADIVIGLKKMCSERVTERVGADGLGDFGQARGFSNGFLEAAFVQVMTMNPPRARVG